MVIMVGFGMVLVDNLRFNCRFENCFEKVKVIFDCFGRVVDEMRKGWKFCFFEDGRVIFFMEKLEKFKGIVEVYLIIELVKILKKFGELGIDSVLVEGGRIVC